VRIDRRALDVLSVEDLQLVYELVVQRRTEQGAALALGVSLNAVKGRRRRIYTRLGIGSRRELTRWADGMKMVSLEGLVTRGRTTDGGEPRMGENYGDTEKRRRAG